MYLAMRMGRPLCWPRSQKWPYFSYPRKTRMGHRGSANAPMVASVMIVALCVALAVAAFPPSTAPYFLASSGPKAAAPPVQPEAAPPDAPAVPAAEESADAPAVSAPGRVERIAVYEVDAPELEPRVARVVTDAVVAELRKLHGLSVVSMDELRALLAFEAERQMLGCESGESCVAEIADALGVDAIVVGNIATVGEERVFGLKRLDQNAGSATQASRRLEDQGGEELLAAIGPLVQELFPTHPLRVGESRGVDARVALRINPPPLPVWGTVAMLALGTVAASGFAFTGIGLFLSQQEYERLATLSVEREVPGKDLVELRNRGQGLAIASNVLGATSAVLVVAGGVMVPWTDWTNAGAEE